MPAFLGGTRRFDGSATSQSPCHSLWSYKTERTGWQYQAAQRRSPESGDPGRCTVYSILQKIIEERFLSRVFSLIKQGENLTVVLAMVAAVLLQGLVARLSYYCWRDLFTARSSWRRFSAGVGGPCWQRSEIGIARRNLLPAMVTELQTHRLCGQCPFMTGIVMV